MYLDLTDVKTLGFMDTTVTEQKLTLNEPRLFDITP